MPGQCLGINQHTVSLHLVKHLGRGDLDATVDVEQLRIGLDARIQHGVQMQGDIGVFGGIARGLLDIDLLETNLGRALACDLLVGDGSTIQVALGQRVHAMGSMGLEHIRLQQGVMFDAAHRDAVVAQHMHVVLQVLADLAMRLAAQPTGQALQHRLARQLIGCTGITMRKRHIAGSARLDRKRQPDDLGGHRVERGGLGVEGSQCSRLDQRHPAIQTGIIEDCLVVQR